MVGKKGSGSVDVFTRIAAKTDSSGGPEACWVWSGAKWQKGTPTVSIGERAYPVRRLLWERGAGPVPEGRAAVPGCGNRTCVNPAHLELALFASGVEERFWSHVDRSGGPDACWPWVVGAAFKRGYGMFRIGWKKPLIQASRFAYQLTHGGELVTEQFVMHSCDNPPCCNPAHLSLGNAAENNADMWRKGRGSMGPKHGAAVSAAHARKSLRT